MVMCAHGLALMAIWLAALALFWKISGSVMLAASAVYYFRQLRQLPVAIIEADETGYRLFHQGGWVSVLLQRAFITTHLTVIQFRTKSGKRIAIPMLADSATPDDYRHLRVWLRWVQYSKAE